MRVAILSTYPPRRCGLATFTADLRSALVSADSSTEVVVAAVLDEEPAETAPEVFLTVRQHERGDYARAALALNGSGVDVVLVEHEYGIFGGDFGEYLVELVEALSVPYVVTLHTLLREPGPQQRAVLRRVLEGASRVTVFTAMARDQLVRSGLATWDRVAVVNHGAPEHLLPVRRAEGARGARQGTEAAGLPELGVHTDRRVLSTFGLLSPGKGIEVALRALPSVVENHEDVLYVVAGRTHPDVVRREGERYRAMLQDLVADLGLQDHVLFVDRYLSDEDIRGLLHRTELFVTPYRSEDQVVSGVLTFALVAGCPVLSTPYFYATEVLSTGAGRLVGVDDHEAMAAAVSEFLGDEASLEGASRAALELGTQYTWPEVGRETLKVIGEAARGLDGGRAGGGAAPTLRLTHLRRMVDPGGIVQHAVGLEPDRSTGYCVDDVARLGLVAAGLARRDPRHGAWTEVACRSAEFLAEAWEAGRGAMRNFRAADGGWLDEPHHGDHVGRAIWALGEMGLGSSALAHGCRALLHDVVVADPELSSPRSASFAILGLARLPVDLLPTEERHLLRRLGGHLASLYEAHASAEWQWFEDELTYDNGRLPQALVAAGASRRDADQVRLGLEALEWYCGQCAADSDAVVLVGNHWRHRHPAQGTPEGDEPDQHAPSRGRDEGDEQPLDAAALVEACVEAFRVTGSPTYCQRARNAFAWFHGRNRWGLSLYDEASGGCRDGVGPDGLNPNEGAESTLAYLQAWLALESVGLGQ